MNIILSKQARVPECFLALLVFGLHVHPLEITVHPSSCSIFLLVTPILKLLGRERGGGEGYRPRPWGGCRGVDAAKKSPERLSPHATGTCRPGDEDDAVRDFGGAGSAETHRCGCDRGWTDSDRAEFCVFVG